MALWPNLSAEDKLTKWVPPEGEQVLPFVRYFLPKLLVLTSCSRLPQPTCFRNAYFVLKDNRSPLFYDFMRPSLLQCPRPPFLQLFVRRMLTSYNLSDADSESLSKDLEGYQHSLPSRSLGQPQSIRDGCCSAETDWLLSRAQSSVAISSRAFAAIPGRLVAHSVSFPQTLYCSTTRQHAIAEN